MKRRGLGVSRKMRDRRARTPDRAQSKQYTWIRVASGAILVALGLLLFFHRDWWLQVALHRALEVIGLGSL